MKSTTRYIKKSLFSIFFVSIFTILNTPDAKAGFGVQFNDGILKMAIEIDNQEVLKIHGLPLRGDFYYLSRSSSLIYKPSDKEFAYKINVTPLEKGLPKVRVSRENKHNKMAMGYDTVFWRLQTADYDCKEVYGSQKLGKQIGVNMMDFTRLNIALQHLMGEGLRQPCESHVVSSALGGLIGFPLEAYDPSNKTYFEVVKIVEDESLVKHELPKDIRPFDDDAYATFLESLLSDQAKHSYMQTRGVLGESGITKVKALKRLLIDPANRRDLYQGFEGMPYEDKHKVNSH